MFKKSILYVVVTVLTLLMITSVAFAHGDETADETGEEAFTISNTILVGGALLLAVATTGTISFFSKEPLTKWQYGIAYLGSVSGFIHLGLGLQGDMLLLLNGLGYLALLAALFWPSRVIIKESERRLILWVLLGYTAITFIGYFLTHPLGGYDTLGLVTKIIEVGLMAFLIVRIRERTQQTSDKSVAPDRQLRS